MTAEETEIRAAEWVARHDRGMTPAEARALDEWLDVAVEHRVAYLRLSAAWTHASRLRALPSHSRPSRRLAFLWASLFQSRPTWVVYAMSAAAVVVASMIAVDWKVSGDAHDYSTPIGARETVALTDGSKVTLNTSTRLTAVVNANERTVWLREGEAFFDVAHDASRPFIVVVDRRRVVVTGTRFSVRREGERIDVTVLEGHVRLQSSDALPTVVSRNESAIGVGSNVLVTPETEARSMAAVGWLDGRLYFDQSTMADAAAQFNRYNRKRIVIVDAGAAGLRIGGSFEAANVEAFARLVESGFGLNVVETGNEIRIASGR